jgi:cytoskeletal protein RodZ
MRTNKQSGFAVLELVLVFVGLAIIALVTFHVLSARQASDQPPTASQTNTAPSDIKSDADLAAAEKELDKENLDAETSDEAQLDAELANF